MPIKKSKQPPLPPEFLRVTKRGAAGGSIWVNLSYVQEIESGVAAGVSGRIVFLSLHDGKEIGVARPAEIAELARILKTTAEDLLR